MSATAQKEGGCGAGSGRIASGAGVTAKEKATPRVLSKVATGIHGFDEISRGGLPRNRTSLVMGGPGTGKTVFALQALVDAARERKQPGIFVAFETGSRSSG